MTPGMRLRSHLIALVLAVLVPMVVFAAIVVVMFGRQQRAAAERGALETARALMNAVDETLGSTVTTLEALATARSLAQGDLKEFHAEARRVLATQRDWKDIILLALDGRQLVDTARPFGAPLPSASDPASPEAVVLTRRPVVGDIARGRLSGEYAVPVRGPVMRSERIAYVLTGVLKPAALGGVLARQRIPADWIGTVFDRRNMIVVRTRSVEEFLGRSLSPDLVAVLDRGAPEGWAVTRTLEGTPVYTAYARSPRTGWGIAFGIPRASVDAPLERSLLAIGAGGIAFAVLALALAALVGRRITAPMATLADAARHFGEGGRMHADGPAGVSEVDDVRQAFVGAAALVQQRAAEAEGIRLQSVLDPHAGVVAGDPDRLRQVTWNLLMNAVKFTPNGGRVQARLQHADSHVEIVVSDTGRGIAPDVLPFVFERFRQADSSSTREHAGLGLGLALAKHLVELHGGSITAQSPGDGQGATFVVRLPLAVAEPTPARPARAHPMTDAASAAGARLDDLRVLVVDDDREALDLAVAILAGAGALVRVCASAPESLEALRTWRPDVRVSDIEMPGEDGYMLIRKVRALGAAEGGHTPAVALTA